MVSVVNGPSVIDRLLTEGGIVIAWQFTFFYFNGSSELLEICPAQYSHHFIFLEIFSGIACNHFHHHSPLSTLVCALCPFHRFHLSFAGNYHLILVKIFLHLDGRTLTSASKVEICRQASSSHHQIVIWICFCIKKKSESTETAMLSSIICLMRNFISLDLQSKKFIGYNIFQIYSSFGLQSLRCLKSEEETLPGG